MKNLCVLFLAILANLYPAHAVAGSWLQKEGEGQVITTIRRYTTNSSFDPSGERIKTPSFKKTDIAAYGEYGLRDYITIGGELDFAAIDNDNPLTEDVSELKYSYANIFARAELYKSDSLSVALEPGVTFPRSLGNDLNSDGNRPIPELKIGLGYSFQLFERYHFFDNSFKYRLRADEGLKDMVKAESVLGLSLNDKFTLLGENTYEQIMGKATQGQNGNYNLMKLQLSVLYHHNESFTHQLGGFANIYGQNTGAGHGLLYSIRYDF